MKLGVIILAAGEGKRMKSDIPKVLHKVAGYPMLKFVIDTSLELKPEKIIVVIGKYAEKVKEEITEEGLKFIVQEPQLGTGHAVSVCKEEIKDLDSVLILYGDVPLISKKTLIAFLEKIKNYSGGIIAMKLDNPGSYGRVVVDKNEVILIREYRDADESEKKIKLVNTGIICYKSQILLNALKLLSPTNDQNEYYLTDVVEIIRKENGKSTYYIADNVIEFSGVNDKKALAKLSSIVIKKKMETLLLNGVNIISPENTVIEKNVQIGRNSIIYPFTFISNSNIGENCIIYPHKTIINKEIPDNTIIK